MPSGERFLHDLEALLTKLHRASADFFRSGRGGQGKRLVPESVFAAHLTLGFELLGWRVEREAHCIIPPRSPQGTGPRAGRTSSYDATAPRT